MSCEHIILYILNPLATTSQLQKCASIHCVEADSDNAWARWTNDHIKKHPLFEAHEWILLGQAFSESGPKHAESTQLGQGAFTAGQLISQLVAMLTLK